MVYLPTLIQCIYSLVKIDRNFVNLKNFKHKWFGHYVIIYPMLIGISLFPPVYYPAPATININISDDIAQVNHKNTKKKEKNGEIVFHKKGRDLSPEYLW